MINDTIADMLTRIRNANLAKHQIVQIPSTKITKALANVLLNEGLIEAIEDLTSGIDRSLLLSLKYTGIEKTPVIEKIQSISKPGLRVYSKSNKIPRVLGGFGIAIISTSQGLMTDRQARSQGVGGEILCYIW